VVVNRHVNNSVEHLFETQQMCSEDVARDVFSKLSTIFCPPEYEILLVKYEYNISVVLSTASHADVYTTPPPVTKGLF